MQHLAQSAMGDVRAMADQPRASRPPPPGSNSVPSSSTRSKGKRRAPLPWDFDDSDSDSERRGPTRKHRRCDGSPTFGYPGGGGSSIGSSRTSSLPWAAATATTGLAASMGSGPVAASGGAFGLVSAHHISSKTRAQADGLFPDLTRLTLQRSVSRLPVRPPPLSLPSRPTSLFRRATSDPPPCSPTTFHVRHDPCFDTLNDALCRAQEAFVQGFAEAAHQPHATLAPPPAPPASPSWEMAELSPMLTYELDPMSSPLEMPNLSPDRASSVPSERSPCAIPRAGDDPEGVPDLCASSSETSAASWFDGLRFVADVDAESDEDDADIIIDPRRHSVDDLCVYRFPDQASRQSCAMVDPLPLSLPDPTFSSRPTSAGRPSLGGAPSGATPRTSAVCRWPDHPSLGRAVTTSASALTEAPSR